MTAGLFLYALLLLILFHAPALLIAKKQSKFASVELTLMAVLIGLAVIAIFNLQLKSDFQWSILLISSFAIAAVYYQKANRLDAKQFPIGGLFAIGFTFIAIQNPVPHDIKAHALILFALLFLAALKLKNSVSAEPIYLFVFVVVSACLFLSALHYGDLKSDAPTLFITSHHWSAYLSPVFAIQDGAVPFRDIPIQYGIGPTALLAAFCQNDCWYTMSVAVPALNGATFIFFFLIMMRLTREEGRDIRYLGFFALLSASIFWIGNPAIYSGPFGTPSVNGMRFIFLSIAIWIALRLDFRNARHLVAILPIWIIGSLWSMESFFFVSAVFTCALTYDTVSRNSSKLHALKNAYLIAASVVFFALILFLIMRYLFEVLYQEPLNLRNFVLNFIYLPGPLPVDWPGLFLLIGILLLLAASAIYQLDRRSGRGIYIITVGFVAGISYYLSRSHDNNIVNLFPLLIILVTALYAKTSSFHMRNSYVFWLAGLVAGPAIFNFGTSDIVTFDFKTHRVYLFLPILIGLFLIGFHNSLFAKFERRPFAEKSGLTVAISALVLSATVLVTNARHYGFFTEATDFSITKRKEIFSKIPEFPNKAERLSGYDDILALMSEIEARADDSTSLVLINSDYYLAAQDIGGSWTSINNISNVVSVPDNVISEFVTASAKNFQKSGWIIIEKGMEDRWLPIFLSSYQNDTRLTRGNLTAYHLIPR